MLTRYNLSNLIPSPNPPWVGLVAGSAKMDAPEEKRGVASMGWVDIDGGLVYGRDPHWRSLAIREWKVPA